MRRTPSSLHLFFTLALLVGLLFGISGQPLVQALGVSTAPAIVSFKRQSPATSPTNADELTFRVTFSGAVTGVDAADFMVHVNTTPPTTSAPGLTVTSVSSSVYDVKIYGGNLDEFNGFVGLDFSGTADIKDVLGHPIVITEPPFELDEFYVVDHINPTVSIDHVANAQADPANTQPIVFTVLFSEKIDAASFTSVDITQGGSAPSPTWSIADSGDHQEFTLSGTTSGEGTLIPIITAGKVKDLAGNGNDPFIKDCDNLPPDNCVTLEDNVLPTVTINQAAGQPDPTGSLPIMFTVTFSEPINRDTFQMRDITQNGTAPGVFWGITTSDNKVFTLTAKPSGYGTLIPSIAAGKVNDLVGNLNVASTSTDNIVTYGQNAPTSVRTPTATLPLTTFKTVVITEVAWMGTAASTSDEWIELYNNTSNRIYLDGWHLMTFRWSGTPTNGRWAVNLDIVFDASDYIDPRTDPDPKSDSGYFLLERGDNDAVKGVDADKIYTGTNTLMNDLGEIMLLCNRENIAAGDCNVNKKEKLVDYVNASIPASGSTNPWPAGAGNPLFGSMERKQLYSDENIYWYTHPATSPRYGHDRNWNGTTINSNLINGTPKHPNWAFDVSATPGPTPTPTRTPTPAPQAIPTPVLVLNEVMARAGSDWNNDGSVDVYDEFIEVMNAGKVNVNLGSYKLDDGLNVGSSPYTLPNQTLKPGEIAVFFGSQTGIRLEDSGDTVRLLRGSNNSVLDSVTYPIAKSVDTSVCRYTDGYGSWLTNCFPTPGRPNALTGDRYPSTSGGSPILVCYLPDSVPDEFVLAECGEEGGGIWNYLYWNSFPGEGEEIWLVDPYDKWPVIYQ